MGGLFRGDSNGAGVRQNTRDARARGEARPRESSADGQGAGVIRQEGGPLNPNREIFHRWRDHLNRIRRAGGGEIPLPFVIQTAGQARARGREIETATAHPRVKKFENGRLHVDRRPN